MTDAALLARAADLAGRGLAAEALKVLDAAPYELKDTVAYIRLRAMAAAQHVTDKRLGKEAKSLFLRLERLGALELESAVNFAILLKNLGELDSAAKRLEAIAEARPDFPGLDFNLGAVAYEAADWKKAGRAFRAALTRNPTDHQAARALGQICLGLGDFAEGWRAYEARLRLANGPKPPSCLDHLPLWDGSPLDGRVLALWGEQGLGEEILFGTLVREMAEKAAQEDARLVLIVDPRLQPLFARQLPDVEVLAKEDGATAMEGVDLQAPVGALGAVLRASEAQFPAPAPALVADPARRREMRQWLDGLPGARRIGISWRSRVTRAADKKSIPMREWKPLLGLRDTTFVTLQYGETAEDLEEARRRFGVEIAEAPGLDCMNDLDGLAALISELDGVVTISNATAHLSGALGAPTTLLLAPSHFWYWGYRGEDACRWYAGMTILRRPAEKWSPIMRRAQDLLATPSRPR